MVKLEKETRRNKREQKAKQNEIQKERESI
jgi:hypothetical protein